MLKSHYIDRAIRRAENGPHRLSKRGFDIKPPAWVVAILLTLATALALVQILVWLNNINRKGSTEIPPAHGQRLHQDGSPDSPALAHAPLARGSYRCCKHYRGGHCGIRGGVHRRWRSLKGFGLVRRNPPSPCRMCVSLGVASRQGCDPRPVSPERSAAEALSCSVKFGFAFHY